MSHWSNNLLPSGSAEDLSGGQAVLLRHLVSLSEERKVGLDGMEGGASSGSVDEAKLGRFMKLIHTYSDIMSFKFTVSAF